jgi:hypothetical protein
LLATLLWPSFGGGKICSSPFDQLAVHSIAVRELLEGFPAYLVGGRRHLFDKDTTDDLRIPVPSQNVSCSANHPAMVNPEGRIGLSAV